MKLTDKQIKYGAGILVLVGAYLVLKEFFGKKSTKNITQTPKPSVPKVETKVTNKLVAQEFPIKKGNRDEGAPLNPKGKVVELQKLINTKGYQIASDKFMGKPLIKLVEDGIFGTKTEQAVKFWIDKKSIDNQLDLNYLKNRINPQLPK